MADFVQHPVVQALAWALVHFLWQGAAIGLAAFLTFRLIRTSARVRYAIGVGALAAMVVAPAATFLALVNLQTPLTTASSTGAAVRATVTALPPAAAAESSQAINGMAFGVAPEVLAVAVVGWIAGVAFFSIRLLGGWMVARRLARRAVRPASDNIQALARQLAGRLGVGRVVAVLESSAIAVPVLVGWLKPAVVLPLAALAGLSPTQMESLLAHELAHVHRHDYLVNLLQSVAEALLFYHPAVWWLSRQVRAERELCCDDLAVGVCDRLVYATALTDLATMASPRVALAATDGDLLSRVRRILGQTDDTPRVRAGAMPVLALALVIGVAVPVALASAAAPPASQPQSEQSVEAETSALPATLPVEGDPLVDQTAQQRAEQQRMEELRRKYEELLKALAQKNTIEQSQAARQAELQAVVMRKALDDAKKRFEMGNALQATVEGQRDKIELFKLTREAQLESARKQFEQAKMRFDRGLINEAQLMEARTALANAEAEASGNAQALKNAVRQIEEAKLEPLRSLQEKGLPTSRNLAEQEAALRDLVARLTELRATQKDVRPEVARTERDRLADELVRLKERLAAGANDVDAARRAMSDEEQKRAIDIRRAPSEKNLETVANAAELVRAGDVLRITIEGEPDLPNSFNVTEDGTIRMPFLGTIKVTGLTSANVRAAVGKQLSDRKLGSAGQVKVTLLRSSRTR